MVNSTVREPQDIETGFQALVLPCCRNAISWTTDEVLRQYISWSSYMQYVCVSFPPHSGIAHPSDRSPSVFSTVIAASYGALTTFQMTDGGTTLRVSSSSKAEQAPQRIHINIEGRMWRPLFLFAGNGLKHEGGALDRPSSYHCWDWNGEHINVCIYLTLTETVPSSGRIHDLQTIRTRRHCTLSNTLTPRPQSRLALRLRPILQPSSRICQRIRRLLAYIAYSHNQLPSIAIPLTGFIPRTSHL